MALSYKNDTEADERLNPANLRDQAQSIHAQEQQGAYNRDFDNIVNNYDKTADPANENRNIALGREQLGWNTSIGTPNNSKNPENLKTKTKKFFGSFRGKKKGATVAVITILGGGIGLSSFFLTGFLAPVAWATNVVDDLNDQLASLNIRNDKMLRAKISTTDRDKALSGCTKLSIRCKFRTMSTTQVKKFAQAGIDVVGDDVLGGKRIAPKEYIVRDTGKRYSPREFSEAVGRNGDPKVKNAYRRALNMKYIGVSDKTFVGRTLARWGLSRKPPELTGTHEERVDAMMNRAKTSDTARIKFVPVDEDEDGNQRWAIEGDDSGDTWSTAEKDRMQASLDNVATRKPPSLIKSGAVKAIGVIGAYDMACTINNTIGMATIAAKVANNKQLAEYAITAASMTGAQQSGELSYEDSLVLQEFFNKPDERRTITDIENSFTFSEGTGSNGQGELIPNETEAEPINNPYFGKTVMDSPFYELSSTGNLASIPQEASLFSLGVSQNSLLSGVSNFSEVLDTIVNLGTDGCGFVQNWFVRGASIIGGVALGILSGGGSIAVQATVAVSLIAVSIIAETMLNNALSGDVIHDEMDINPSHRAAAQWTGTSAILGDVARSRGMIPGNSEALLAYQGLQSTAKNEYIAAESEAADPFDITNQYSALGSFAMQVGNATGWSQGDIPAVSNIASIVGRALPMALRANTAFANIDDPARYEVCDDEAYNDLGINADVQCNVRYYLPAKDLELDSLETALWMEENNYVADETETGLPEGYTPPNPAESQSIAESLITGFTDQFFATRNYADYPEQQGEYAKFLDYCAYRVMPWGKTYEESSGWGGAGEGWVDGSKCLEDSEMLSRFRIYTFDKTVQSGIDEEEVDLYATPADDTVNESPVVISDGQWSRPTSPAYSTVTQRFGNPVSYNSGYPIGGGRYGHNGVDLAGSRKSERVYAGCSGATTTSRVGEYTYANTIVINCGNGITIGYHHAVLTAGSTVTAGQDIGYTDLSGTTTGYHLHLTVKVNGVFVEPLTFFRNQGVPMP